MDIVHIILGKANPDRMNGVNKVVNELATRQSAAGYNVEVWGISSNLEHNYPERNYKTRLFKKKKMAFILPNDMLKSIVQKKQYTIYHLHGGFVPEMYLLGTTLSIYKCPFVLTPHGAYNAVAMERNRIAKRLYYSLFESKLIGKAAAIHVLGQSEEESLLELKTTTPVCQIPYGFQSVSDKESTDLSLDTFTISYCGRIDIHTKGLDALVEGFGQFVSDNPNSELLIIGNGEEMPALEKMAEKFVPSGKIRFTGAQYGAQKTTLLRSSSVFAHPSRNEGMPSAVLEAAALGIPCLVTKATNVGQSVRDYGAGEVIERTDAESVCDGLTTLYRKMQNANKRKTLSASAIAMIEGAFNWSLLLEKYMSMYRKALK
jgi:glycosyltransferase involved in cell wall biosynthesis